MKFSPTRRIEFLIRTPVRRRLGGGGFTLAEVLAALLVMAIVIPVALQGLGVASRAGILGERKTAAMRVAERVLNEQFVTGQLNQAASSGTVTEGDLTYPWTIQTAAWPQDAMTQVTVHVTFDVQGRNYEVSASTLFDPAVLGNPANPATP